MRTLVVGASTDEFRYSNRCIKKLLQYKHIVFAVGLKGGDVDGVKIETDWKSFSDIHTITLYVNPQRQKSIYSEILNLNPKRIIFNPGTENSELVKLAEEKNILCDDACSLVMLATGIF